MEELFVTISLFLFGAVFGSFLNAVIYRLPLTRVYRKEGDEPLVGHEISTEEADEVEALEKALAEEKKQEEKPESPADDGEQANDGEEAGGAGHQSRDLETRDRPDPETQDRPDPEGEVCLEVFNDEGQLDLLRIPGDEIDRVERLSVFFPRRSICPSCNHEVAWYDNIPLLSYFILLGRCRHCGWAIPIRYFIVELVTPLLLVVLLHRYGFGGPKSIGVTAVWSLFAMALVVATFIDFRWFILPDEITKGGMVLGPILSFAIPALHPTADWQLLFSYLRVPVAAVRFFEGHPSLAALMASLVGLLLGAGLIWGIRIVGKLAFRKEAMGFGDVKFMGMIGAFVGWKGVLLTLLLGSAFGAVIGIFIKLSSGDSYIPFGPFLSLGALLYVLFGGTITWVITVWYPHALRRLLFASLASLGMGPWPPDGF